MLFLAVLALVPLLFIYSAWAWAVVVQKSWMWLIVTTFATNPLTFAQAIAISVMIGIFFVRSHPVNTDTEKSLTERVVTPLVASIVLPWVVLLCNWLVYLIFI